MARAQNSTRSEQKPLALKIGLFIPSNNDARASGIGDRILAIEADYTVQTLLDSNSISVASIGLIQKDDLRILPVTISQVFRDPGNSSGNDYYYGFGIGIYATSLKLPDTSGETKNLFGGFIVVGMDLGQSVFVEGKYHYISKYDNKFIGGLQLSVGGRF